MTWLNESDVRAQLDSIGLILKDGRLVLRPDGRSTRCKVAGMDKEPRGWYRLSEWPIDSGVMLVGTYGIFQGDDPGTRKIELTKTCEKCGHQMAFRDKKCPACGEGKGRKRELTPEQKAAMAAKFKEDQRRAEAERNAEIERAATWAGAVWRASRPVADVAEHDYLQRKGLTSAHGARIYPGNEGVSLPGATDDDYRYLGSFAGALVIPICDPSGRVFGVEFILSRQAHKERIARIGRDKEFWPAGMSQTGKYYLIGGTPKDLCLLTEGFATGATLAEASGLPVAIAYAANNLQPVVKALRKHYRDRVRYLVCADDDWVQECSACNAYTPVATPTCAHCGAEHRKINAGVTRASETVLAVPGTAWVKPEFADPRPADKKGPTDFNDLASIEGINVVRGQIEAAIAKQEWRQTAPAPDASSTEGGGDEAMVARLTIDEAALRYWGTYGLGGKALFDSVERRLVHKDDVLNLLPSHGWEQLKNHPDWRVARDIEIGFDPTESDPAIRCNLFGGWPTTPRKGNCTKLLELLEYLCANEDNDREVYQWILKWLAYPLQVRGAKMHSAIVVHGGQGTGKSRFFEAYAQIFGPYGRVLGQEALEDKFNADWAEKKLFILADEVLARQDMYHIKNRLKGFITGGTIRVNPKNVAAHNEKNQMNIVFLSNERQPLVLENDDRRHLVIWVPPKLNDVFFAQVNDEIDNGGIAALHHHLLGLDLGDFKPWTKPPMTKAKQDLVELGRSSEERFLNEWIAGEIDGPDGDPLPFCPCLGSHLYRAYERWCDLHGERKRGAKDLISLAGKLPGWKAGESLATWENLQDTKRKNRKMIVPAPTAIQDSVRHRPDQDRYVRDKYRTQEEWLTVGFFAFDLALGAQS